MVIRIIRLLDFSFLLVVSALLLNMLVLIPDAHGNSEITCHRASTQSSSLLRHFIQDGKTICTRYQKQPDSNTLSNAFTTLKAGLATLMFFASGKGSPAALPVRSPLLSHRDFDELLPASQNRLPVHPPWLRAKLIPSTLSRHKQAEMDVQLQKIISLQQQYSVQQKDSGPPAPANRSSIYLSIVNLKPGVIVVPPNPLTVRQRSQLYERFLDSFLTLYLTQLSTLALVEWLPNAVEAISVISGAGGDDGDRGDRRTKYDPFPYDFSVYPETGATESVSSGQRLGELVSAGINQKNRLLNILRNRFAEALEAGNRDLAFILRDRIMVIEADWRDIAQWLQHSGSDHSRDDALIASLIDRLMTNTLEVQDYEDASLIRMIEQSPVFLTENPQIAIIVVNDLDPAALRVYAGWQRTASGILYRELKKRLGRLLQTPSPNHGVLINLITNLETLVRQFNRYHSDSVRQPIKSKPVADSSEEPVDADADPQSQRDNKSNSSNQDRGNSNSQRSGDGSGQPSGSSNSFKRSDDGDDAGQNPNGRRNSLSTDLSMQIQLDHFINAFVVAAGNGDEFKIQSFLSTDYKKELLLGQSKQFYGDTALHAAIRNQHQNIVQIIESHCTNEWLEQLYSIQNDEGKMPLELAGEPPLLYEFQHSSVFDSTAESTSYDEGKTFLAVGSEDFAIKVVDSMEDTLKPIKQDLQEGNLHSLNHASNGEACFESFGEFQPCSFHTEHRCLHGLFRMPCCSTEKDPKFICDKGILKIIQNTLKGMSKYFSCCLCKKKFQLPPVLENARTSFSLYQKFLEENKKKLSRQDALNSEHQVMGIGILAEFCETTYKTVTEYLNGRRSFDNSLYHMEDAECCNCLTVPPDGCFAFPACNHPVCMECWGQLFQISSTDMNALSDGLRCPGENCITPVPEHVVEFLNGPEALSKINAILMKMAVNRSQDLFYCLVEDCDHVMILDEQVQGTQQCPKCEKTFCAQCMVTPGHDGLDCATHRKSLTKAGAESIFNNLVQTTPDNYKLSPCCGVIVYKVDGCDHMKCPMCLHRFSWRLQKKPLADELGSGETQPDDSGAEGGSYDPAIDAAQYGDGIAAPCQICSYRHSTLLYCLHRVCDNCYEWMIQTSTESGDYVCRLCLEEHPNESALQSEATGYTNRAPQRYDQRVNKVNKRTGKCIGCWRYLKKAYSENLCASCFRKGIRLCLVCNNPFRSEEGEDICSSCLRGLE